MPTSRELLTADQATGPFFVGLDLGGTSVKIGVVDDLGRTVSQASLPTRVEDGPERAAQRMAEAVKRTIEQAGLEPSVIARLGLGSPGTLDLAAGKMTNPVNFPGWEDFPIRDRVAQHCGLPVAFSNDATAAAYGEFWVGSGRAFHSMIFLTLGTGIGCGIIIGDLLIEGENGHGTECGHTIIDCSPNARLCSCGQTGHLEAYASATALVARADEVIEAGRATSLSGRMADGEQLTPLLIAEEAEAGDELALELVMETARYLGIGIVSLLHTIDPSGVLLGGAMTFGRNERPLGRRFLDAVHQEVASRAFPLLGERTVFNYASLGADAGYLGAAGIARLEHQRSQYQPVGQRQQHMR